MLWREGILMFRGAEQRKQGAWGQAPGIHQSFLLLLPDGLNEDDGMASGPKGSQTKSFISIPFYLLLGGRDILQRLQPEKQASKAD